MANKSFTNRLKNIFGIGLGKSNVSKQDVVVPAKKNYNSTSKPKILNLPSEMNKLYNLWLKDVYEDSNSLKNRMSRYASLQFAWYNSPVFSMTVDLFADEVPQAEKNESVIVVEAKQTKVKKYIEEFFSRLKINSEAIRDLAWDLALYGDSFRITPVETGIGVQDFVSIDVFSVKDRYEFKAVEVSKKMNKNKNMRNFGNKDKKIKAMLDTFNEKDSGNLADFFKTYLFGFELDNNLILPPWYVSHFRLQSQQSEFWPFGRSVMINSLGPFRQLQAAKNLMALSRANSFPIKHFEVEVDPDIDPASAWEAVDEAREEFHNLSNSQAGTDEFVANSEIWTASGQLSFSQIDNDIDLDRIADVEFLRDELIMGTRVPKGYLIVDKASFGTSGQSLLRQHKPFSRAVYRLQSAILSVLTELVRLQFASTGDFDYDEPFELSMTFPMVEESSDRIRSKNDTLRLAKDVLDDLGAAVGLDRDEALPPDVVKQVLSQLSFLDSDDIENWIDTIVKEKEKNADSGDTSSGGGGFYNSYMADKTKIITERKKLKERINKELIKEVYFSTIKKNNLTEGLIGKKHYFQSNDLLISYKEELILDLFRKELEEIKSNKLMEKEK